MDIDDYMRGTRDTAQYPGACAGGIQELAYLGLGFAGEAGEVANDLKKLLRGLKGDRNEERIKRIRKELGDALWYWARLCDAFDFLPSEIMAENRNKLLRRKDEGKIGGSGGDR